MEFCAERELCVGNTYFKHRSLHKYTKVARGEDGIGVKSMVDLVVVKKDILRYVQDVGCDGSEKNGMRPLRSLCDTV